MGAWAPGPQPPKDKGPNVALIVLIAIVVVAMSSVGGCLMCVYIGGKSSKPTASSGSSPTTKGTAPTTSPASGTWITAERPYVKFTSPPGWRKDIKSDWAVFKAPDGASYICP